LFRALKDTHGGIAWTDGLTGGREPDAISAAQDELSKQIEAQKFYSFFSFNNGSTSRVIA